MKRALLAILIVALIYIGSYVGFRQSSQEVWEKDGNAYVIFPENKILYYVYRPMTLIDSGLTGMRFHIGPHR